MNVGYQWAALEASGVDGAVFRASGQDLESALRRERNGHLQRVLFDPQVYLLDYRLSAQEWPTLLQNLCTYPWMCADAPSFDSSEGRRRDWLNDIKANVQRLWANRRHVSDNWRSVVESSVLFQQQFGCTEIILPSPLLSDPEDDLDNYFLLLDQAVEFASSLTETPLLVSIPLDESVIAHREPEHSALIEALADGIATRDHIAGAYICVSKEASPSVQITNPRTAGSVLRLCRALGQDTDLTVVVNFADGLGVAALGFGASAYASGYSVKCRCLRIEDYQDRGGGAAYPKLHAFHLGVDLLPESDLEKLRSRHLLRYVEADRTASCSPLLDALNAGRPSSSVPQWEQRRNNVAAAQSHHAQIHAAAGRQSWTPTSVHRWLQEAEAVWTYFAAQFENDPLSAADGRHLGPWRLAVERLIR